MQKLKDSEWYICTFLHLLEATKSQFINCNSDRFVTLEGSKLPKEKVTVVHDTVTLFPQG